MDVSEAVASRRSIRAFRDTPVDRELLVRVLDRARQSPSGANLQPWHAVVVTGEPLRALIGAVAEENAAGRLSAEEDVYPPHLPEPYKSRRWQCGESMYAALGIGRGERDRRIEQVMRNYAAFGAPVLLMCHIPALMRKPQWADMGMWLQTVMLLLRGEGLDSCPQAAWSLHGGTIKRQLDIPDDHVVFCGLAIGHADPLAPVNRADIGRANLAETVRFEGF